MQFWYHAWASRGEIVPRKVFVVLFFVFLVLAIDTEPRWVTPNECKSPPVLQRAFFWVSGFTGLMQPHFP